MTGFISACSFIENFYMKKLSAALFTLLILFTTQFCKKSNGTGNNGNNNSDTIPKVTATGIPTGPMVSKFIPSGGGSIATADGRVELIFPNGSLASGDTITIQNITNNGPGGMGDAYRFLPEGLKFANPITIKFNYADSDVNGTIPQLLEIGYQDSTGVWNEVSNSTVDTTAKTLSATITHFSDWYYFPDLTIAAFSGDEVDGTLRITKKESYVATYTNIFRNQIGKATPVDGSNIKEWDVNNIRNGNTVFGSTVPFSLLPAAGVTYTAPAQVPGVRNPVAISVKLQNFKYLTNISGKLASFSSLTLVHNVKILGNDYKYAVFMDYEDDGVDGGLEGYPFKESDEVSYLVTVKNGTDVTISAIINYDNIVTPSKQTDPVSGLSSTVTDPGQEWHINGGAGTVFTFPNSTSEVNITLLDDVTKQKEPLFTRSDGISVGGNQIGLTQQNINFYLNDSTQNYVTDPKIKITIKPQH